jgi:phosphohistidine phosphatase
MDLILWRHAEAQEWEEGCDDLARPLTSRGEKQAARMAAWLDRQLPQDAQIWVSPAQRTVQTAHALGRSYSIKPELAPDQSPSQLLESVQWSSAKGVVLVVGHQPTLGQVIAQLLNINATDCSVKKGAVWWLRQRQREDASQTVVVTVQSPELL